jgi:hypothetical protein
MSAFPIVEDTMREQGGGGAIVGPGGDRGTTVGATPWYRRWYTIAGAGVVVFAGAAIVAGLLTGGIDADAEEIVGD